mgnify:FL=1
MCWLSLPFVGIGEFRTVSNVHAPVTGRMYGYFSKNPVAAGKARKLGNAILTEAMKRNGHITFNSYDRFFPNQDRMPEGGFGNLIALPLQGRARKMETVSLWMKTSFSSKTNGLIYTM